MKIGLNEILALVSALLVIGAIGLGWFATNKIKRAEVLPNEGVISLEKEAHERLKALFVTYKKIQTNILTDGDRLRHIEMEISLEPMNPTFVDKLKSMETFVDNEVISIVSEMSYDELISISSKIVISEKLKNRINEEAKEEIVKRILFPTFTVN
ncbi:MAG: flagellar basal body-associated FliL family protein [Bacteriovoracaceae bacterium]|nr:flagellar basal body-associated FliL family protein [Bacteriovoracaceae bacterium]